MVDFGNGPSLPEKYRITLALSFALLVHTLAMSVLPFNPPEIQYHPRTVKVEITPRGSQPSAEAVTAAQQERPMAEPFTVEEQPTDISSLLPLKRPAVDSQKAPTAEPEAISDSSEPLSEPVAPVTPPQTAQPAIPQSISSVASVAGDQTSQTKAIAQEETIEKRSTKEESPEEVYLGQLAARIGEKGKRYLTKIRQHLATTGDAEKRIAVKLELKLIPNGTLVGAKIIEDSGYPEVDQEMYRAALLASPYPEPPDTSSGAQKFVVELFYGKRES